MMSPALGWDLSAKPVEKLPRCLLVYSWDEVSRTFHIRIMAGCDGPAEFCAGECSAQGHGKEYMFCSLQMAHSN